ncbi:MAG: hypothetical protein ABL866_16075 [Devosia sp.]
MYSDSRKAQRNSFAHHRAHLLFSHHAAQERAAELWSAEVHDSDDLPARESGLSLKQRVRAGLLGFIPAAEATT